MWLSDTACHAVLWHSSHKQAWQENLLVDESEVAIQPLGAALGKVKGVVLEIQGSSLRDIVRFCSQAYPLICKIWTG